jgi:hypothetical protein
VKVVKIAKVRDDVEEELPDPGDHELYTGESYESSGEEVVTPADQEAKVPNEDDEDYSDIDELLDRAEKDAESGEDDSDSEN